MYGLEAITAQNGWAMAIAGSLIVMSGLTLLSLVISQLHKIAALLEKWVAARTNQKQTPKTESRSSATPKPTAFDIGEAQTIFKSLVADLDKPFELKNLYERANREELPHVHLSIRSLRESGVIVPAGDGWFEWRD